ncbi:MAG TPA: hypothetical protein VGP25_17020 [Gemmatimonadaceae bacterium]|jgi:hypothetical protein|nr:hypothetical protein [Gemmatimonadaceae bacterium]
MPIQPIGNTGKQYYLVSFDENGNERPESDGTLLSDVIRNRLADPNEKITDVFLASHGWKGDVPAAIEQNDRWMGEMVRSADRDAMLKAHPDFKALNIGLHWPSLPFGDENLPKAGPAPVLGADSGLDAEVDRFAAVLADTPKARAAIRTILEANGRDSGKNAELPDAVREAYKRVFAEAKLTQGGADLGAPPGDDHPKLDAESMYEATRKSESDAAAAERKTSGEVVLGGGGLFDKLKGLVVSPLQQASFWKMKNRARAIGEGGIHTLLDSLMRAAGENVHFHLMGHSFGCIVVSAAVAGPPGKPTLPRGVDTLFLVQGALSLWSYCSDIPFAKGTSGYFRRTIDKGLVRGPIVTTRSRFDNAVGKLYPPAADLANEVILAAEEKLPKYGGIGTFGVQGLGAAAIDGPMQAADFDYGFEPKGVYNLEASGIIKDGGGFSGAHSDIAHPEVAHVMWQAVAATR